MAPRPQLEPRRGSTSLTPAQLKEGIRRRARAPRCRNWADSCAHSISTIAPRNARRPFVVGCQANTGGGTAMGFGMFSAALMIAALLTLTLSACAPPTPATAGKSYLPPPSTTSISKGPVCNQSVLFFYSGRTEVFWDNAKVRAAPDDSSAVLATLNKHDKVYRETGSDSKEKVVNNYQSIYTNINGCWINGWIYMCMITPAMFRCGPDHTGKL
jgi:hypothetical protein